MDLDIQKELSKLWTGHDYGIYEKQSWVSILVLCTDDINKYIINDIDMYHVELKTIWFSKNDIYENNINGKDPLEFTLEYINKNNIEPKIYLLRTYPIEQKIINSQFDLEPPMNALEYFKNDFIQYFKSKKINSKIESDNYFILDLNEADEWYKNCKALHKDFSKAVETNF